MLASSVWKKRIKLWQVRFVYLLGNIIVKYLNNDCQLFDIRNFVSPPGFDVPDQQRDFLFDILVVEDDKVGFKT